MRVYDNKGKCSFVHTYVLNCLFISTFGYQVIFIYQFEAYNIKRDILLQKGKPCYCITIRAYVLIEVSLSTLRGNRVGMKKLNKH